jgi:hypothetical protein
MDMIAVFTIAQDHLQALFMIIRFARFVLPIRRIWLLVVGIRLVVDVEKTSNSVPFAGAQSILG